MSNKLSLFIVFLILILLRWDVVNAETKEYYVNENGIEISEDLYTKLRHFYSRTSIETITAEEIETVNKAILIKREEKFVRTDTVLINGHPVSIESEISEKEYEEESFYNNSRAVCPVPSNFSCWETTAKKVVLEIWVLSSQSGDQYQAILTNTWKPGNMPAIRSYDIIAIRYNNWTASYGWSEQEFRYSSNGAWGKNEINWAGLKKTSNGAGATHLLPITGITQLETRLTLYGNVKSGAHWYGTYQHAISIVTLSDANNYTFSSTGLGGVVNHASSTVRAKYDGMRGVDWGY